ncbi:PREDICTED: cysteine-rich with EGF-like domain protein 2 [Habropoda laboriosa]|uniref:cysteine-rich with EGF-like domain protein 2 n=1 Tax=Habropoda laboriosa TaxID=597456 RepID=UPI00083D1E87|nr:PREDICTED: cysteine-rich with EGF-like domain protein 2 [Habropoda laboriosa]
MPKIVIFFHLLNLFLLLNISTYVKCNKTPLKEELKSQKFPPCAACKILINSFKKGIERTSRDKFDGGDSAWEEDKLGSYSKSETRLIEIQEHLCKEVERGETQCHTLAEQLENQIEDWWFNYQQTRPDIYEFICIEQTKQCCPKDHFGSECTPCPGFPDKVCNNNGKCKGAGTRKGNGECLCDKGYEGSSCTECASGFYEAYKDENKLLCSPCHAACDGPCNGPGPKYCMKCMKGWYMLDEDGCFDIDECMKSDEHCPGNQFCINKEGSYTCLSCDRACNGCTGDGPDMCIKCADGYYKKDNLCINSDILGRKQQENVARYATYFGLCVATCIIFQRNIYIASVIGLLVGIYISVSEYMIAHSNVQDTTANVDILGPA